MDETELRNVSDAEIERRKRVDVICDDFERQWAEGNPPSIEGTLGKLPEEDQRLLFQELLKLEIEIHRRVGKNCDRDDYRKRFPDRIQCIDRLFASSKGQAEPPGRTVELKPNDTAAAHAESVKERANSTKISSSSSETSQDPDPTSIDRFTIHGKLGVGGFGIVYLATDPLAGRDVAIKVPKSLSPSKLEMFLEDARTASQLTHPGIVRIYEVSASPLPYVVQEYLPGGDLGKHVRKRKLSPHAIVELMI
ncbi:MAG: protein kinase [Acidobacteriota bacterium]